MYDTPVRVNGSCEIGIIVGEAEDHSYVVVRFHDRFEKLPLTDIVPLLKPQMHTYGANPLRYEFHELLEGYSDEAISLIWLKALEYNIARPSLDFGAYLRLAVESLSESETITKRWTEAR